jgi:hypothetical protein
MANYKTTSFTTIETIGDAVYNQNMITSATMSIVPNPGYVVSASNFSTVNLPNEISAISFTDNTTAGQIGNTITVIATLAPDFVLERETNISIPLIGDADPYNEKISETVSTNIKIVDDRNINNYGSTTVESEGIYIADVNNITGIDGNKDIIKTTITGDVTKNVATKVGVITINADDGYYFKIKPYLQYLSPDLENLKLSINNITRDSNNRITSYKFDLIFKSSQSIPLSDQEEVNIIYRLAGIPETKREITNVIYGNPALSELGAYRPIKVYGDIGAEFDLTITREHDGSSLLDNANLNLLNPNGVVYEKSDVEVFTPSGVVRGINKTILPIKKRRTGINYCVIKQTFPENSGYKTTINGSKTSTTITINGNSSNVRVGDQLIYNSLTAGTIVKVTSITDATNIVLDTSVALSNGDAVNFVRPEKYHINIYPKAGTTLGPKFPIVKPHFVLEQRRDTKLTITASKASSNYTLTTYAPISYVGKANTNASKNSGVPRLFDIKIVATRASSYLFSRSDTPVWSNTEATSGTATSCDWTNSVHEDDQALDSNGDPIGPIISGNGGTHIKMFNLSTTLSSSNQVATVKATVRIIKFGQEDVTMNLDLDRLLTAE